MTSFGDLLGPQPTLLPGDDDAESALLNNEDPAKVAADHPTASIAWAYLAEAALDRGETIQPTPTHAPDTTAASTSCAATAGRASVPCPTATNPTAVSCAASPCSPAARTIGESDEHARCLDLLEDCDPRAAEELGVE